MRKKVEIQIPQRVLIIDARPLNHYIIAKYYHLNTPESKVTHCYSATEALKFLETSFPPPDLILNCLPPSEGADTFHSGFHRLPPLITRNCRVVRMLPFSDPGSAAAP